MAWEGERLRSVSKEKGVSLSKLAEVLKVSRQTVNDWVKGQVPKGNHLMEISRLMEVPPGYFFRNDNQVHISIPLHRKRGLAKLNDSMREQAVNIATQYGALFKSAPEPGLVPVMRIDRRDPENAQLIAAKLRELSGIEPNRPLDYDHTFQLLHGLKIVNIFRQFPPTLKGYAFYCRIHSHRVVFVNTDTNILDLIFPLLHETVHAIRDEEASAISDPEEELFCDTISNLIQFPEEYVTTVLRAIKGRSKGIQVNLLKEFSKKNAHSMFGIVEQIKRIDPELDLRVGGANSNLKKLFPSIGHVLFKEEDARVFVSKLKKLSPLFFEILETQIHSATIRRVGEWLGLESGLDAEQVAKEIRRIAAAREA
jgi:transcriptional regulator with XRE-family HTH domain